MKICASNEVDLVPLACEDMRTERSGLSTVGLAMMCEMNEVDLVPFVLGRCAYGTKWT